MITDTEAERVAWEMRENAESDAQKRADRLYLEQYLKSKKAQLMQRHEAEKFGISVAMQEREALADPEYIKGLKEFRDKIFDDEYARHLREAGKALLDAWRTQQATERAAHI